MKACNLCDLDFLKTDFEIFRTTSGLTSEADCQFTTIFSVTNPLILCAPPQIFIVEEKSRSDLVISPTHSGVRQIPNKPTSKKLFTRTSSNITYGLLPCVAVAQSANPSRVPSDMKGNT